MAQIGENFSGGIVFVVTSDGQHGLIAETQDQGRALGDDVQNRVENPEYHSEEGKEFNDWYLPGKDELNLLYHQKDVVGGFDGDYYWSSWKEGDTEAWVQRMDDGSGIMVPTVGPYDNWFVRSIRAF